MDPPLLRPSCLACEWSRISCRKGSLTSSLDSGAQVQLACDGRLPCGECASSRSRCAYPQPPPFHSGWTSDLSEVESWPEPVYLKQGVTGSARLATALTKEGKVKRIDWQLVLGQQQGVLNQREVGLEADAVHSQICGYDRARLIQYITTFRRPSRGTTSTRRQSSSATESTSSPTSKLSTTL